MNSPQQNLPVSRAHAEGAILGALVGDAAGATLEFIGHQPSADEVDNALTMVGGGVWRLAPGQITDDGELTLALAQALTAGQAYDPIEVASQYRLWYLSHPFDIGNATRAAMGKGEPGAPDIATIMQANAARSNSESKANGSLMRATPLGVWGASVSLKETIEAAKLDALLSHPNPSCQWAGVAYAVAIRHLIHNPGDRVGALQAVELAVIGDDAQEVLGWLDDAEKGNLPACHPMAGFVRIAFTYAFHHLRQGSDFVTALRHTLLGGGDTDTNACIVGGLLGALHGVEGIPEKMRQAVLYCETDKGQSRPEWLQTRYLYRMVEPLVG